MDVNRALENQEVSDITYVCGGVDDLHMDIDKLPFERYVIATDEDSDKIVYCPSKNYLIAGNPKGQSAA